MPTSLDYHPEAREEVRAAYAWYLERNVEAADEFLGRVVTLSDLALDYPDVGSPYLYNTRRLLLRNFPYLLVYRRRGNGLQIVAIAHTSRRPGYWRDRLD